MFFFNIILEFVLFIHNCHYYYSEASPFVLSLFRNFGTIVNYQYVGNSNWMNLEYKV